MSAGDSPRARGNLLRDLETTKKSLRGNQSSGIGVFKNKCHTLGAYSHDILLRSEGARELVFLGFYQGPTTAA